MMHPKKPDPSSDASRAELQRLLQEALKRKRPRWIRLAVAIVLGGAGVVALLAWLFYSTGEQPPVVVVAFDDLAIAGEAVKLHGRLEALADGPAALAGREMVFVDGQALLPPGQQAQEVLARTGQDGEVACTWKFPADNAQGNFILRQIGDRFRPGMEDRGSIFLVPRATALCLVQMEDTLTRTKNPSWRHDSIQDIVPVAGAAEALQEARKMGYEIIYLALAVERPTVYQRVRGWVRHRSAEGTSPLPSGVVVSRFTLPFPEVNRPWQKAAEHFAKLCVVPPDGPPRHLAIAGTIAVAQQFHAAGWHTLYLGAGEDLAATVQRVPGWEEVRRLLEK